MRPARERCGTGRGQARMVAWRLAALWLGLIAAASVPEARGAGGVVIVDRLEVMDEPDPASYASDTLREGERVVLLGDGPPGWLAIRPPRDAFDWVDASAVRVGPDGGGEVVEARAAVRTGCAEAKLPGPPRPSLPQGTALRMVDRPPLALGRRKSSSTWLAIVPPVGEIRFVRAEGVRLDPAPISEPAPPPETDGHVRPAQYGGTDDDPVRRFEEAIRRSRSRDQDVALARRTLADARTATERAYDARGLLQASSRKVDGQKVHALIGPEGVPVAYLSIPPGLPAFRLLARKVGVRGDVRYNESLGARLITVRDMDALDQPR
ncbi:hypothetical protein P12x_005377 [Tundrisphaera lichenicola]|uniref:hypothetical protein n=1 Tax=Tundrisphaera lichenicola TaxID=2029860 RepID=UPI003EB933F7